MLRRRLQEVAVLHDKAGQRSIERFVLDHGRGFSTVAPARKFLPWVCKPNVCFTNCIQLAFMEGLTYVEGFAILSELTLEVHHAWCLDREGRVIDPTWTSPGKAYFGVPFANSYVRARYDDQAEFGETGSLLTVGDDDLALVLGSESRPWRA